MKKYFVIFGTDFDNKNTLDSKVNLTYCDSKNNKTVWDIKDFITCYDDSICTCMLKLYQYEGGFFSSYIRYPGKNEDKKSLKEIVKDSYIYIGQVKKNCSCNFLTNNNTLCSIPKKNLIEKINALDKKDELISFKEEDFYDIIIDINSILAINNGWNIKFTEKGRKKYDDYKYELLIKIGILGNVNNGKSLILSKLSRIPLPTGTAIGTKGLSIKYPDLEKEYKNRKYILLDSAGLEYPILTTSDENEEHNKKSFGKNYKEGIDQFKLNARDILVTESFLQSFIISVSDLLLIVIDKLSFSEQKLINKIKGEIRANRIRKPIFIIHNLKTYRTKVQMEEYINNILNKSSTFNLTKGENITLNINKVNKGIYFIELNSDINVFHLLFAAEGSEAGNCYNDYTIDFIEEAFNGDFKKNNFDIIEEVKSKFVEYSARYFSEKININDLNSNEDSLNHRIIKLKEKKELILNKVQIDEIGFQTFKKSGFEPKYNIFQNGNSLEIRVELPGNVTPCIKKPEYLEENTIFNIYGEKKKDKEPEKIDDNFFNSREFGNFNLEIQLKTSEFNINPTIKEKKLKNGILFLKYDFTDEKVEIKPYEADEEL